MISIVITVHEPLLKHLERCVDSIIWQMSAEDELIIIGDRCNPARKVVYARCPGTIATRIMQRQVLSGASATRNLGLENAAGDWIKFLDADDLLAPFALNAFRAIREKVPPEVAVVAGSQIKVHNGLVIGECDPPNIEDVITRANPLVVSMAFVRRSAANGVAGFDERIDFEEDWDFWLRLRRAGHRFAIHRRPFCYYLIDDAERAEKKRTHTVEGMPVREYLAQTYGINPGGGQ